MEPEKDKAQLEIANFSSFHKLIEFHMSLWVAQAG